jgi:hypothetical protein
MVIAEQRGDRSGIAAFANRAAAIERNVQGCFAGRANAAGHYIGLHERLPFIAVGNLSPSSESRFDPHQTPPPAQTCRVGIGDAKFSPFNL